MKKFMLFIAIIIASGTISTYANGEKVHLKLVFEAVDAQGNRDTAEFAIRDRATNGLDPELGEVNLYGVPPQGDLDIRLVQRTKNDSNLPWLRSSTYDISFPENVDLKKDYRSNVDLKSDDSRIFALKVFAKYYPINVNLLNISNYNSIDDIYNYDEISVVSFDESNVVDAYNLVLDNNNNNSCIYSYTLDKVDTAISYKNNDTIYNFIAEPELIRYSNGGRTYTFGDSVSKNYILKGKYVLYSLEGGINDNLKNDIKLYPNPSNGFVAISEGNEGDTFEIVNSAGDKISNFAVEVFPFSYDVSALPAGVYYIINTTSGNGFGKFVKE